jgi:uncharacterized protein
MVSQRPAPTYTPETKPFWDALNEGRFLVQQCQACKEWQFPYRGFCSNCWSGEVDEHEATSGTVFTHSTIYKNDSPGFEDDVPYVAAMVQLDEDRGELKIMTNIVDCDPDSVHIGMPVELTFMDTAAGQKLPVFTPRRSNG